MVTTDTFCEHGKSFLLSNPYVHTYRRKFNKHTHDQVNDDVSCEILWELSCDKQILYQSQNPEKTNNVLLKT